MNLHLYRSYQIAAAEMAMVGPEMMLFLMLIVIGGITAHFKKK
jgi:hypothetical protein